MPRIAISAVTTSASDQSGTAARIACSSRSIRSCAWRTANSISSKAMRCSAMLELLARKPVHVRLGPRRLARDSAGPCRNSNDDTCWRLRRRSSTAASRARVRSRIAS